MIFENTCNCIVYYKILEDAIVEECRRKKIEPKDKYKIYMYRGYAGISLKHEKVSIHRIIRKCMVRIIRKCMVGYNFGSEIHVHHIHIDENKLNNDISNLQIIKNSLHTKEHNPIKYVSEKYKKDFGNRVKDIISRKDVTKENVFELRDKGLTISQISKELDCGYNTVCRRLGMKL